MSTSSGSRRSSPEVGSELAELRAQNEELTAGSAELTAEVSSLKEEVSRLREMLTKETGCVSDMWKMNCAQVVGFDEAIIAKDIEIGQLKAKVSELEASSSTALGTTIVPVMHPPGAVACSTPSASLRPASTIPASAVVLTALVLARRAKSPPVNGEDPEYLFERLATITRASQQMKCMDRGGLDDPIGRTS